MPSSPLPSQIPDADTLKITVELTGGLELLFNNVPTHNLTIPSTQPDGSPVTMKFLIHWLVENVMDDSRKDMFVAADGEGGV